MGRGIRRVPKNWEHPKDYRGHLQPMFDRVFDEELNKWLERLEGFKAGDEERQEAEAHFIQEGITTEQIAANPAYYLSKWDGGPPDADYHRPTWQEEPVCYQVYETVSEGTPVSPVFETLDHLKQWLVDQGYSEASAKAFAETGWAPTGVMVVGKGYFSGIDSLTEIPKGND